MFTVSDEFELLALQGALIEAKLPGLSLDRDLSASPLVARLAERATESCRQLPERIWPREEAWRSLTPTHARWGPALARALSDHRYLKKATRAEREEYARLLLSPYRTDEGTVATFLDRVEHVLARRRWYQLWMRINSPCAAGVAFLREREDGTFYAVDAAKSEIAASRELLEVTDVLVERDFEPQGFYVEEAGSEQAASEQPASP